MAPSPQAAISAAPGDHVIGWKLEREQRRELLERFPPKFSRTDADHVTLKSGVSADAALPDPAVGEIVGRADDGRGVEAMVVRIDGTTDRPGGGTYHITWSLEPGRRARESNDLLAAGGWTALDRPVAIRLVPARIK